MSRWLRNLQGQLTELASEVLTEATEEVADPESELQVLYIDFDCKCYLLGRKASIG
jgi:hypothetical protein